MKKNLVFVAIEKLLKKDYKNMIFGSIQQNHPLKKKFEFIEINDDFLFKDRKHEFIKMQKFYEKKINELVLILNKFHQCNYNRQYWEIIIGPFLDRVIFISRFKWLMINKNIKKIKFIRYSNLFIDKNKLKINDYLSFINHNQLDEINAYIYSKVLNKLNLGNKIKVTHKINFKKIKSKFQRKNNSLSYLFYQKIFSIIRNQQKYLFFQPYFNKQTYFFFCLRLLILPFKYDEFEYVVKKVKKNRNLFHSELLNKSNTKFESFFNEMIFDFMPASYIENYKKIETYCKTISINPKIIFTANAHLANDTFKIWTAQKVINGSKVIASDHGCQLDDAGFGINYKKIYHKYIKWPKSQNKNFVYLPSNQFAFTKKLVRNNDNKILIILSVKYKFKTSFPHRNGNDFDQYELIKKNIISCMKNNLDKIYFRLHPWCENKEELKKLITSDFGPNKIDKNTVFGESLKRYSLVIDTDLESTFLETFLANIPIITIVKLKFKKKNKNKKRLIERLIKNKIIIDDLKNSQKFLTKVVEDPYLWWNSSKLNQTKKYFLNKLGFEGRGNLYKWTNFFQNL